MTEAHNDQQIEVPLPADWITPEKYFGVTFIDFAGPLYINVGSNIRKGYIAIFTCPAINSRTIVQAELSGSLN